MLVLLEICANAVFYFADLVIVCLMYRVGAIVFLRRKFCGFSHEFVSRILFGILGIFDFVCDQRNNFISIND